ncbi:hypothetical protein IMSAGC022_01547 [Alistipes sp.]|jgi:hypothetical protein|nr:hypothetical protein IMSAGC022_01547 [Alistipes sp.]
MIRTYTLITAVALSLAPLGSAACSYMRPNTLCGRQSPPPASAAASSYELPLPAIPSSLRTPHQRASYLIEHFWDGMDFSRTHLSRDSALIEQNFVNYLSLFPHADTASHKPAVRHLIEAAAADAEALSLVMHFAEKYLYEQGSPMLCEEYFIEFLEAYIGSPRPDEYEKIRPAYLLENARKNRPGMTAADFGYEGRDGRQTRLHDTPGQRLLLLFYDPDCVHCRQTVALLQADARLRYLVDSGELTVLAVYSDGDRELWERSAGHIPTDWIDAFDTGEIAAGDLYVMPAMPSIYLLDSEKRVVGKDITPQRLFELLE